MSKNNERIYLSSPHMSGKEMKYVHEAFNQNWIAPLGPNVDAFEKDLENYCGLKYATAMSSGTAALHLALILLGVRREDEVIAPTFTFSASINPIIYQGAKPILIDSEPETWNMEPELLENAIRDTIKKGKKAKAIIVVHLYGMPAKMDKIMDIANEYEIPVIEDAAEALGSTFKGKHLGAFGRMGVLSFNGNKIITTSGGGALISGDKELIQKARYLSTQARDTAIHYQHSEIGYNYRMSNILAGIGRGQMEVIDQRIDQRRKNYLFYKSEFKKYEGIKFLEEPSNDFFSNRWLTTMLIDSVKTGITREFLQKRLEKANIESRPLWKPMHMQPVFKSCKAYLNDVSKILFTEGICLPSGSNMTDDDRLRVSYVINNLLNSE